MADSFSGASLSPVVSVPNPTEPNLPPESMKERPQPFETMDRSRSEPRSFFARIRDRINQATNLSPYPPGVEQDLFKLKEALRAKHLSRAQRLASKLHFEGAADTTPLICAVQHGDLASLSAMVPFSDLNQLDARHFSFLDWIILERHREKLATALSLPIWHDCAPLLASAAMHSVAHDWVEGLEMVLAHSAWQPAFGAECAKQAVLYGRSDLFPLLAKAQCLSLPSLDYGSALLFEAIERNQSEVIPKLIAHLPVRIGHAFKGHKVVDLPNALGQTPLMRAVRLQNVKAVSFLLPHADTSLREKNGNSALALAIQANAVECCAVLAAVTPWDQPVCNANHTALKLAVLWETPDCIPALIAHHPRKQARIKPASSPSETASTFSIFVRELIDELFKLSRPAKPGSQDGLGLSVFKALFELGHPADINGQGVSLLKGAFHCQNAEYSQYLWDRGHVPADFSPLTRLHLAVTSGRPDYHSFVCSVFEAPGFDGPAAVNTLNSDNETPLSLAVQLFSRQNPIGLRRKNTPEDSLKCLRLFWPHATDTTRRHAWKRAVEQVATGALEEMAPEMPIAELRAMFAANPFWAERMPISRACIERDEIHQTLLHADPRSGTGTAIQPLESPIGGARAKARRL